MLGAWINGGDEHLVQWLLHIGVPCYIIHQYCDVSHGIHETRNRHSTNSFCPPDIWHLRDSVNAYEAVAIRNGTPWSSGDTLPHGGNVVSSHSHVLPLTTMVTLDRNPKFMNQRTVILFGLPLVSSRIAFRGLSLPLSPQLTRQALGLDFQLYL